MGTYKRQAVGIRVHLGVLSNVPVWHPWAHDANWKQRLRNLDDREYVRVRIALALFHQTAVYLV